MAIKSNDEVETPKSTGAVKFDDTPKTVETQAGDNTSTGAVEYKAPGETIVAHYDDEVLVNYANPEPVTVEVPWRGQVQAKVVTAPDEVPVSTLTEAEVK